MPRLPRARLSDFDGLYSVYSLPNIVLPLVGGMIVDRWGVAKSLCLFTLLILLGQAIFAAACRCATLHSPPPAPHPSPPHPSPLCPATHSSAPLPQTPPCPRRRSAGWLNGMLLGRAFFGLGGASLPV
jgi:MFS family permease